LTDFGTSKNVQNAEELFRHSVGMGTPVYMAPEVLATEGYNTKADVFSFGTTLWEMWTRKIPWSHVVCWNVPALVIKGERPPIPGDCPEGFAAVIRDCWQHNPKDRPCFSALVGTLSALVHREKREPKRMIPAPERSVQQLRELRLQAEMQEDSPPPMPSIESPPPPPPQPQLLGKPSQRRPSRFRSPGATDTRHSRALSLDDGDGATRVSLPPLQGQGSIRIGRSRKTSTRSLLGMLVEEQKREALAAAESAAAAQEQTVAAEKKRKKKKKKKVPTEKHKKGRSGHKRKVYDSAEVVQLAAQEEMQMHTPSAAAPLDAGLGNAIALEELRPVEAATAGRTVSIAPLTPRPSKPVDDAHVADLLMQRAPLRRRPSWDLGDMADAVAFKKIEDTQFKTFRRGKTIARGLGDTPMSASTTVL